MAETRERAHRLSANLDENSVAALARIEENNKVNRTEAIKRAVYLLDHIESEYRSGRRVLTVDRDGKNPLEIMLLGVPRL